MDRNIITDQISSSATSLHPAWAVPILENAQSALCRMRSERLVRQICLWQGVLRTRNLSEPKSNSSQQIRNSTENLRDSPHIAAYWFRFRFKFFLTILRRKFKIKDYWTRYDWQS